MSKSHFLTDPQVDVRPQGHLYALPANNRWLLAAPLHGTNALINESALALLREHVDEPTPSLTPPRGLQDLLGELQRIPALPQPPAGPIAPRFLGIVPTRGCNMRCGYCGFGAMAADSETMDLETVRAGIDWMAERMVRLDQQVMEIHFFGGEPLVAHQIVEAAVHYGRSVAAAHGLVPHFELSTNGVFSAAHARWIGDYVDAVVLSLDGFSRSHNRQRPLNNGHDSHVQVIHSAELLATSQTDLCLRCCVTEENVDELEQIATWFCERFSPGTINFEPLAVNGESQASGIMPPDPYAFARHCHKALRAVERRGIRAVYSAVAADTPRLSPCPVGQDAVILTPSGRANACYMIEGDWQARNLEMNLGQVEGGQLVIELDSLSRMRQGILNKPRCERCFCRWGCAGGCHVTQSFPGCSVEYNAYCVQTRILTACQSLDHMGLPGETDALLADREAMQALALWPDDRINAGKSRPMRSATTKREI